MEDKLKELIGIRDYFREVCSDIETKFDNVPKLAAVNRTVRDIFTSTLTTKYTASTVFGSFGLVDSMLLLPAAYGGTESVQKYARAKEIAEDWVAYKDALLANASSKAYITVTLDNAGDPVITLTDPYA